MSTDDHDSADLAGELRRRSAQQWVHIADDVLEHALSATRRSLPLRAATAAGAFWVAEQVVVAKLQEAIDAELDGAAVGRIAISATTGHVLTSLTVELFGRYGHDLLALADEARRVADSVLATLGLAHVDVDVMPLHMHFGDVTVGDPHDVDPADER
ncbi:hypothetical protein [Solicola sp. PLA-1-18]|uniref:hypothetical protein n=1 Tax=Solicola sp. PLA-1-18 TaxID=3380532 RepID=UPI003B82B95E